MLFIVIGAAWLILATFCLALCRSAALSDDPDAPARLRRERRWQRVRRASARLGLAGRRRARVHVPKDIGPALSDAWWQA